MAESSFNGGLEILDKSDLNTNQLIDHACAILNIDLATTTSNHIEEVDNHDSSTIYTFREQWVLRWILKRIASEHNKPNGDRPFISEHKRWMLLLHLLCVIPRLICAEILIERKFFQTLDSSVRSLLRSSSSDLPVAAGIPADSHVAANGEDEHPRKRLRLSPDPQQDSDASYQPSLATEPLFLALNVSCRCAYIIASQPSSHRALQKVPLTSTWSSSVQENASLFAASLQTALALVRRPYGIQGGDMFAVQIQKLQAFWTSRPVAISDALKTAETTAFNIYCLGPCLELITICRSQSLQNNMTRHLVQTFEKLLALHTIIPLRTSFNDRHSKLWKQKRKCLSWEDIRPFYEDSINLLASGGSKPDMEAVSIDNLQRRGMTHHLYSIAVRLIPKTDFRRKQWEQPWLDALLASLSYLSCQSLPKLAYVPPSTVEPLELATSSGTSEDAEALSSLLQINLDQGIDISLQLLSYLASAVLSVENWPSRWRLVSIMIASNVNVIIPGLAVPTTDHALDLFRIKVEKEEVNAADYALLRDKIVLPLVEGFARSRALKEFFELWRPNLHRALIVGAHEGPTPPRMPGILVWQDEDIFDQVTTMIHRHATPSLLLEIYERNMQTLTNLGKSPESDLEVFAEIAICASILETPGTEGIDTSGLEAIQEGAMRALQQNSDHQGQRWRLWNLIHQVQAKNILPPLSLDSLTFKGAQDQSLSSVFTHGEEVGGKQSPARRMECLGRFSLLVQQASRKENPFLETLRTEIDILESLITSLPLSEETVWNGRLVDLGSPQKLVSACLGRLLSHPEVGRVCSDLILMAAQKLLKNDRESMTTGRLGCHASPNELLLSLTLIGFLDAGREGSNELFKPILETIANLEPGSYAKELISDSPIEFMSKSRLKKLASEMFGNLSASSGDISINHLAFQLALMERVSLVTTVSFCQPEAWTSWIDVFRNLEKRQFPMTEPSSLVAIRCLTGILRRIVTSAIGKEPVSSDVLVSMVKWSKDMLDSTQRLDHGISRALALDVLVSTIWNRRDQLTHLSPQIDLIDLSVGYAKWVTAELAVLAEQRSPDDEYHKAGLILQALSDLDGLTHVNQGLIKQVQVLDEGLKTSSFSEGSKIDLGHLQALCCQLLSRWDKDHGIEQSKDRIRSALDAQRPLKECKEVHHLASTAGPANALVQTLDSEGQADLLELIAQPKWRQDAGVLAPCLLAAVIVQADLTHLSNTPRLVNQLALTATLHDVSELSHTTGIILALENARLTVELHPKIVNQSTIDTLLDKLVYLLSSSSPITSNPQDIHPKAIFDRICALLGILLSHFRRRVADRHHLLLPVLQQLLRYLFFPGSAKMKSHRTPVQGSNPAALLRSLPHWLRNSPHALPPSSATHYTRIVSAICNPTVSAAHSSRKRSGGGGMAQLTDQTAQVRSLAGQHMQYLIMDYTRSTLDGEISSAVKEKLLPGLYTVLDAMGRDVMRGMNAAMDPSCRAVFKGLYDDWVRYGRWDKT